ncbi:MAG: acyl-CoA thioesterase [Treponema sp.]|jgi:acyl-CoA thioester hydrolase|nr:acyl-CoA thioesterase [Treponema sp.]
MRSKENNGPYNIYTETEIDVEFYDLDPLQVVWHGNYIKYFETGRRALLEKIGYSYEEMVESGFAFPVTETTVKYPDSLRYKDRIRIKAILEEYENCLIIRYEIRNVKTGKLTTKGSTTQMAYDIKNRESCFVCPEILVKKVSAFINGDKQ